MKSGEILFEYPYSQKWVLISCILVATTIIITFFALTDVFSFLLFFVYTLILTVVFLVLKFYLYSRKEEKLGGLYAEEERALQEKNPLKRPIIVLLIVLLCGLFLPFSLLLFLSPFTWFLFVTGFIAGINIPEIILYIYAQRIRKSNE